MAFTCSKLSTWVVNINKKMLWGPSGTQFQRVKKCQVYKKAPWYFWQAKLHVYMYTYFFRSEIDKFGLHSNWSPIMNKLFISGRIRYPQPNQESAMVHSPHVYIDICSQNMYTKLTIHLVRFAGNCFCVMLNQPINHLQVYQRTQAWHDTVHKFDYIYIFFRLVQ